MVRLSRGCQEGDRNRSPRYYSARRHSGRSCPPQLEISVITKHPQDSHIGHKEGPQPPHLMLRMMIWNARGLANTQTLNRLKSLKEMHRLVILAVIESKVEEGKFNHFCLKLGFDGGFASGKDIWVFWHKEVEAEVVAVSTQAISIIFRHHLIAGPTLMTFVHGSCHRRTRRSLWEELLHLQSRFPQSPWLCGGDFNAIATTTEKKGGLTPSSGSMFEFNQFALDAQLSLIAFSGNEFTWTNSQEGNDNQQSRLDRIFSNQHWRDSVYDSSVVHLNRAESDHAPLLLDILTTKPEQHRNFKYLDFWSKHEDFGRVVSTAWLSTHHDNPLIRIGLKLAATRKALRLWSRVEFGDIFLALKRAEADVQHAEIEFARCGDPGNRSALHAAQARLKLCARHETRFWSQKARIQWDLGGDKNSKFFYDCVRQMRNSLTIHQIRGVDGVEVRGHSDISTAALTYFSRLFEKDRIVAEAGLLGVIPQLIEVEDNNELIKSISRDEVEAAVKALSNDSASGPDGFSGGFYDACWDTVGSDVVNCMEAFFGGCQYP
ncbi:uncharacterized protein M6B38_270760 [Iris pallida]|uniref:Endonuclease/exonuclease/phosphatase domain-containing protein n=1 Tax=Iris pallida TaxID=29817 RepID=A0AAX6I7B4_IRIPA|nr:uncharacterized protein M6B38_270760 [Iris pallida]